MSKDSAPFCLEISKFFNTESINEINKFIDDSYDKRLENQDLGSTRENGTVVKNISSVRPIPYGRIKHLISGLIDEAYQSVNLDFGFLTFPQTDSQYCNFNIYDSNSKDRYDWHCDESDSPTYDIKCTLLINLSTESFEGGEFQLFPSTESIDMPSLLKPGSAVMFKSHILHRVLPVTSGTRKTLTVFIYGPKFT